MVIRDVRLQLRRRKAPVKGLGDVSRLVAGDLSVGAGEVGQVIHALRYKRLSVASYPPEQFFHFRLD